MLDVRRHKRRNLKNQRETVTRKYLLEVNSVYQTWNGIRRVVTWLLGECVLWTNPRRCFAAAGGTWIGAGRFLFSCCINADAVVIDDVVELVSVETTMFLWSVDVAGAILTPDLPFRNRFYFSVLCRSAGSREIPVANGWCVCQGAGGPSAVFYLSWNGTRTLTPQCVEVNCPSLTIRGTDDINLEFFKRKRNYDETSK